MLENKQNKWLQIVSNENILKLKNVFLNYNNNQMNIHLNSTTFSC